MISFIRIYLNSRSGHWKTHLNVNFKFISKYCASFFFWFGPTYVTAIQYKNQISAIRFAGEIMHMYVWIPREKNSLQFMYFSIWFFCVNRRELEQNSWICVIVCSIFDIRCFEVFIFCPLSADAYRNNHV